MSDRPRVLFLFSDTGGGHRSAAEAIIEALELEFPGCFDIQLIDVFKQYAPPPLNLAPAAYPGMVRVPQMWGFGYRVTDSHRRARALTGAAWPYVRRAARRFAREQHPDLLVSVHPVMVTPILKGYGLERPPFFTVVTDLVTTHALWYDRRVDQYVVPTEEARQRALACGVAEARVRVVGLPVAQRFCQPARDRVALRAELDWPRDGPVVLLMGGGEGMGPLFDVATSIARPGGAFALAIVCGRNRRLKEQLEALDWPIPVRLYGFERRIPQMMQAADLLVTKAGPGTITEAINAGLPMVLYSRLPGQEDGNVSYVVSQGVGTWAPGHERAAASVHQWLEDPRGMQQAAAACRRIARPSAAMEIARMIAARLRVGQAITPLEAESA
ncbi:MAG: glycosyltransferase [Chloroflexi bacterium]|nr:glycosyltransferase [Chloroflexota bacterium]